MRTNAERIEAYERFKRKHPHGAKLRVDSQGADISRLLMILAAIVLAVVIGYGVVAHVTAEKPWAVQVIEECEAQGKMPHPGRGAHGEILTVRCDIPTTGDR